MPPRAYQLAAEWMSMIAAFSLVVRIGAKARARDDQS